MNEWNVQQVANRERQTYSRRERREERERERKKQNKKKSIQCNATEWMSIIFSLFSGCVVICAL